MPLFVVCNNQCHENVNRFIIEVSTAVQRPFNIEMI